MILEKQTKEDIIQQQILAAAKKLFHTHGLQKVTMDDVAKAIGKGRSSIYYYYKSKDEIFEAVVDIDIKEMIEAIRLAVEKVNGVEQRIQTFCIAKLKVFREKHSFYTTLDMGMDSDAMSDFYNTKVIHHNLIMKMEGKLLDEILTAGIKSGELKPLTKYEKSTLIFVLLSSLHGLKRELRLNNDFDSIERFGRTLSYVMIHGLKQ